MTTEEKAKAYDDALDRMKHLVIVPKNEKALQVLKETIFPELAESEDERVIRALETFLNQQEIADKITFEARIGWLTWLEKQKVNTEGDFGRGYDCGYQAGYAVAVNEMKPKVATATLATVTRDSEKQKEQKPLTTEETELNSIAFLEQMGYTCIPPGKEQKPVEWKPQPESLEALMYAIEGKWDAISPTSYLSRRLEDLYEGLVNTYNVDESLFAELPKAASRAYTAEDIEELRELKRKIETSMEQKPVEEQDYSGLNDLERAIHRGFLSAGVENVPVTIIKETAKECLAQMKPAENHTLEFEKAKAKYEGIVEGKQTVLDNPEDYGLYKPAEWSDTDNIGWDEAFACVTRAEKAAKNEEELQNAVTAEKWLKEIKFKYPQPKQEWSEEDEEMLTELLLTIEPSNNYDEMRNWLLLKLKSLLLQGSKDSLQTHWKPSEEQMSMLLAVINDPNNAGAESCYMALKSIYNNLKKLM